MSPASPSPWFVVPRPKPQARVRLFCFPFAGSAASVFRTWGDGLPDDIEVCAVQLPGRESRRPEPLLCKMPQVVEALGRAIVPRLDRPFAFFGHSMGAAIAFELARHIRRQRGSEPVHLFASARQAPHIPTKKARYTWSDAQLIEDMRRMGGTPEEVLREEELMQMLLPIFRADLEITEAYNYVPEPPLQCPITALRGLSDRDVSEPEIEGWREHTSAAFTVRPIAAGHFFLGTHRAPILGWVSDALSTRTL